MFGSLGSLSKRLLRGTKMFSRRTLVCSHYCSQDIVLNMRDHGSFFASRVVSVTRFFRKRGDSGEVLIVSGFV